MSTLYTTSTSVLSTRKMTPDQIKQRTQALFLGLYYCTQVLRANTAIRVPVGSKKILIKEPADAILFLLEVLIENGQDFCFQGDLEDLVRRWYGVRSSSSFDKSLAMLDDEGCVTKEPNPLNKRQNKLTLTTRGKRVLGIVKSERALALDPLFKVLERCAGNRRMESVLDDLLRASRSHMTIRKAERLG